MIICNYCHEELFSLRCERCKEIDPAIKLTLAEIKILYYIIANDFLTHEEPARSVIAKIINFANSK